MALVDATNSVKTTDAPVVTKPAVKSAATPNAEKLGAALDDIAGFAADARDAAEAKLNAAVTKDAPGLCAALLGIAADTSCAPGRRLAAATFARNTLRKAWGAAASDGDAAAAASSSSGASGAAYFPPASRAAVRTAALNALIAAPTDARHLLADCLRLAGTTACSSKGGNATGDSSSTFGADLVDDVVAAMATSSPSASVVSPGFLLAVHAAARPFQYFRDPTVTREAPPPALERLCTEVIVPAVLPALLKVTKDQSSTVAAAAKEDSQQARVAFKIMFRLVRAYMPEALQPCLGETCAAVNATCVAACDAAAAGEVPAVTWIAVKRALRLAAALVSRHSAILCNDGEALAQLAFGARRVASLSLSPTSASAPAPAVAAAFALLDAMLGVSSDKGTPPPVAAAAFAALAPPAGTAAAAPAAPAAAGATAKVSSSSSSSKDGGQVVGALTALVRECVLPHVCLTEADRETLTEDPEEYARQNAVGEAAADSAVEEALDTSGAGSGGGGGVTARRAALDFVAALVAAPAPGGCGDDATGGAASKAGGKHGGKHDKKSRGGDKKNKNGGGGGDEEGDGDGAGGKKPPTPGELAVKEVVDAILAEAPKEKVEKVGKAAAAAGAVATYAAPAAELALGESAYYGLLQLHGALAAAAADERRPMKESALRSFCQKHSFPAAASAASPHVAAAAAAHLAAVAPQMSAAPLAREALAALIAALERSSSPSSEADDGDEEDDEDEDDEAWGVTKEMTSWAARAVVSEAPCASDAFGAAAAGAVDAAAGRLLRLVEASPASSAPPLRTLAALAETSAGALSPAAASAFAQRVVAAFAAFAPLPDDENDDNNDADDEMNLDAWETSVEAVAALAEAADQGETPSDDKAAAAAAAEAKLALAAAAAAHVRAYWRAALALEPPEDDDDDEEGDENDAADAGAAAVTPPANHAVAPLLCFAAEAIAEIVTEQQQEHGATTVTTVPAEAAAAVWGAAAEWASHLGAWRARGEDEGLVDDAAMEHLADVVAAAFNGKAGEEAVAAVAGPAAAVAATVIEESDDAATRRAAARALAAAVAAHPAVVAADPAVSAAAVSAAEAATGRRSARAALHLLAAVGAATSIATSAATTMADPAAWMRIRADVASTASWTAADVSDCGEAALLGAHVSALTAALAASTAPGGSAPDKRLFGAALNEAMAGVAALLTPAEDDDGEDDDDEDEEDDDGAGSEASDEDGDDDAANLENETEDEFLERYASIARDMAANGGEGGVGGGDEDDEDDDGEGLAEEDDAFDSALEPRHGDGVAAARAFCAWYKGWSTDRSRDDRMRVSTLVDPAVLKKFVKCCPGGGTSA